MIVHGVLLPLSITRRQPLLQQKRAAAATSNRSLTMAGQMPLLLDPAICNWVLMPIVVVMVLVMILRDKVRASTRGNLAPLCSLVQRCIAPGPDRERYAVRWQVTRLLRSVPPGKLENIKEQYATRPRAHSSAGLVDCCSLSLPRQVMKRAQMLRFHYKYIPSGSFAARRNMLIRDYLTKAKKKDPMAAMQQMQDPDMMGVRRALCDTCSMTGLHTARDTLSIPVPSRL